MDDEINALSGSSESDGAPFDDSESPASEGTTETLDSHSGIALEASSQFGDPSPASRAVGRRSVGAPKGRRGRAALKIIAAVLAVFVLAGVFVAQHILSIVDGSPGGRPVAIDIKSGWSYATFTTGLSEAGVLRSGSLFDLYLKVKSPPVLRPGFYTFYQHEGFSEVLATLGRGPKLFRLTIPDGLSLAAIADLVGKLPGHSSSSFLALADKTRPTSIGFDSANLTTAEGFLYPDTYFLDPTETNAQIIANLMDRFTQVAHQIGLTPNGSYNGLSGVQVVIGASIIEREAKAVSDYPKVARVILNRLLAGKPLQMDSTVRFATGNYSGPITVTQLASPSPYNTYTHLGLPPGPISAPGQTALEAMMHPAKGSWLYFVTLRGRTLSSFFDTYQQQQAAIAASGGL